MVLEHKKELTYYSYPILNKFGSKISHFTSIRNGGNSQHPYGSMNVSLNVGESSDIVHSNRKLISQSFGVKEDNLLFADQVHDNKVVDISASFFNLSMGGRNEYLSKVDGMISNQTGIILSVLSADCAGILLYDPINQAIGAVHSGWRGTVKKIVLVALNKMNQHYGSQPQDLLAVISPCISVENYEVGNEVAGEFRKAFSNFSHLIDESYDIPHVNVSAANHQLLLEAGVKKEQIEFSKKCTFNNNAEFYSARKGDRGRFCSGIMLNKI